MLRSEPFVGVWVSTDTDTSSQTMEIARSGGDDYEVVVRDDYATACSSPGTITGTGLLETAAELVIAQPELTCDDGREPIIGSPPQAELTNFTLELDTATDEVVDNYGVEWRRASTLVDTTTPAPARDALKVGGPGALLRRPRRG